MGARAPLAIQRLWGDIHRLIPQAVLSGIVGDAEHSFGYHLSRQQLPGDDYSVVLTPDRRGASDCASALDIKLPPALMLIVTARLHDAAVRKDPRLRPLREFCGTLDGRNTFPWDVYLGDASEGLNSWDDSHLWHVHLSFLREYADNYPVLAPLANVIAGVPAVRTLSMTPAEQAVIAKMIDARAAHTEAAIADLKKSLLGSFADASGRPHFLRTWLSLMAGKPIDIAAPTPTAPPAAKPVKK